MIVTPNSALVADLRGSLGSIRFQRYYRRYLARRAWTIRAPATDPQIAHRLSVARAAALYGSVRALVYPAWLAYAAEMPYGPFACWQAFNILSVKLDLPTCITPANAAYVPITAQALEPGAVGQVDATWTHTGPPATDHVALFVRAADAYAWTPFDTVDAADQGATITGLEPGAPYEVALIPHTADALTFGQGYHELLDAGADPRQDFDLYSELDLGSHILPAQYLCTVADMPRNQSSRLYFDHGADHFGAAFEHTFRFDWSASANESCCSIWALSTTLQDCQYWRTEKEPAVSLELYRNPTSIRLNLKSFENETEEFFNDYSLGTPYHVLMQRTSETDLYAKVYLDAAHENLKHSHHVAIPTGRRYRYSFPCNTVTVGTTPACSFTVRDLVMA